jgi:D-xylose transport system substrate-binding protein
MRCTAAAAVGGVLAALLAGGCGRDRGAPTPAARQDRAPLKIGFLLDNTHERWQRDRQLFTDRARTLGAEVLVAAAEGDQARQNALAEQLFAAGIKVLVLVPHSADGAVGIVQAAKGRHIPVISYDRLARNADVDLYVSFDNVKVGEMQAQYLLNRAPRGNYILIGGAPTDNNARECRQGQLKVLEAAVRSGAVRVVADPWTPNWQASEAADLAARALDASKNDVVAVVASNDVTAGGVVEALQARRLAGKVLVSGQDAELDAVRRIVAGTQAMTVYKPIGALARLAARAAVQLAHGDPVDAGTSVNNGLKNVPTNLLDPILVDLSNLDNVLIADGFHTRDAVYGPGR